MDMSTGELYTPEAFDKIAESMSAERRAQFKQVDYATPKQIEKMKVGRNDFCPCGGGLKFKKCCLLKQ